MSRVSCWFLTPSYCIWDGRLVKGPHCNHGIPPAISIPRQSNKLWYGNRTYSKKNTPFNDFAHIPWENTPNFPKPPQRKKFPNINWWWNFWDIFQGYVGEILEPWQSPSLSIYALRTSFQKFLELTPSRTLSVEGRIATGRCGWAAWKFFFTASGLDSDLSLWMKNRLLPSLFQAWKKSCIMFCLMWNLDTLVVHSNWLFKEIYLQIV